MKQQKLQNKINKIKIMSRMNIVDSYLKQKSWKVKESSSVGYSYGGLCKAITSDVSKKYWLNNVYDKRVREAHESGAMHIHDLGGLTLYCCGFSLATLLADGIHGIPNIPRSKAPKHFMAATAQIANIITIWQNEIMGAVALNSFDTQLAPYVKEDKLTYDQVKQIMQGFIFQVNSNSRMGAEPVFFNLTFDITPPADLVDQNAFAGTMLPYKYKDCQKEMDMINQAFYEIMMGGDSNGQPFSYPIPTYNIHERFDWENPKSNQLFEMAAKFGYPYFANFLNSDMDVSDVRSMCCRLRLDLKELRKKNGGLFGAGDNTGSIGVVTLNLPRIAYESVNEEEFFKNLDEKMEIAKDSLEVKRKFIEDVVLGDKRQTLVPAFKTYVGSVRNHFSTIGEVGRNEMCVNLLNQDILSEEGKDFALRVGEHILKRIQEFQEETGHLYNYEATPAESTCYRLALKDKKDYPNIYTQGDKTPYYTNSCHIPVKDITGINNTFKHQEDLQVQYTGGSVIHIFTQGSIDAEKVKKMTKILLETYKVPYMSWSPLTKFCPDHGHVDVEGDVCPECGKKLKQYQRITGYLREVGNFNEGKTAEFKQRKQQKL